MQEIDHLLKLLNRVYKGSAWHGPSILETLHDVDDYVAQKRVGNSHSIIQLVQHMTAWRTLVIKRLQGDALFEINDAENFPPDIPFTHALQQLDASQQALLHEVAQLKEVNLHAQAANTAYTYFGLLHGVIHHDIYHIGQILLIKKYG